MTRPASSQHQIGFTLIEVMVSFVLVLVLMMGLNALWTVVAAQFDGLTYRQKAIFRLNGEMERLAALYSLAAPTVAFLGSEGTVDYTADATLVPTSSAGDYLTASTSSLHTKNGAVRKIYPPDNANANFGATILTGGGYVLNGGSAGDVSTFTASIPDDGTTAPLAVTQYSYILATGAGNTARNIVWLDRSRQIVAQLSWDIFLLPNTDAVGPPGSIPCYLPGLNLADPPRAGGCYHLTVYVDFPFRYDLSNNTYVPIPGTPIDTITAQTIVGKVRKQ